MQSTFRNQSIRVVCAGNHILEIEAMVHSCGLAYHTSISGKIYVVTHVASGKLLTESVLSHKYQVHAWIEHLVGAYDWWFLTVEDSLELCIDAAWLQARKKKI